ncbi:MAG: cytochrome c biogenesis protein CcdA [bacterium]|nr:hypothetical protein [Planctomycetota bacterium]HIL50836.1 hypothetical protein [Planctomycetota bacterium]
MNRILLSWLCLAAFLVPASPGQGMGKASASLYTRPAGDRIELSLQIRIEPSFHLYHKELGAPDSVGLPLAVTLMGEGIEFDELYWPEPHRYEQPGLGEDGGDTFILGHDRLLALYGRASLAPGADIESIEVKLKGLACEDSGACYPYSETVKSKGEGRAKHWKDWPEGFWDSAATEEAEPTEESEGFGQEHLSGALFVRREGEKLYAVLELEVAPGEHLGHTEKGNENGIALDTTLILSGAGVEWFEAQWPEPEKTTPEWGGEEDWIFTHHGKLQVTVEGRAPVDLDLQSIKARLEGQVCEDSGSCFQVKLTFANQGPEGAVAKPADDQGGGLLALILAAIGGGIFALLMPCTYPMIPITISFFTKQAEAREGSVLPLSLLYGAGIILIFIIIGLFIGPLIMPFATHPVTNLIMGAMFVFFAAVLFGAFTLNPPKFLMAAAGKASMTGGLLGVFLMGMTLVLTSFTCTAPFVGSLLSLAAREGSGYGRIVIGMGVFGLTMATPFVFLSLVPGKLKSMPTSGEWMDTIKVTLGFIELAAALKFFSNTDLIWQWQFISREMFLLMWAAIFILAALFLFGFIRVRGHAADEIGPGRMFFGTGILLFGLYCWHGYNGHRMDSIMTAIIPNYSSALVSSGGKSSGGVGHMGEHTIIIDDYEGALEIALREGKPVLLNFTGYV